MCGIFGVVTDEQTLLGPALVEAGRRLAYRGYDSVGCATLSDEGSIDLRKDVGRIEQVAERLGFADMVGRRGMTQLRWATFGAPSHANAQPHLDSEGQMVGAHNGNVVNNVELRQAFLDEGMVVRSTNDGESCVHAVERYVRRGYDMVEAIRRATHDLQGDYTFVIGASNDDRLYAVKMGSGLVVGLGDGATCCSSDLPSILPLTNRILRVEDGEIVILGPHEVELRRVSDGERVHREPEVFTEGMDVAEKGGYAHFMLKEIHEQPKVAADLIHLLEASAHVVPMVDALRQARHVYLVGCGTSFHACLLGAVYMNRLAGRGAVPVLGPQFIAQYGASVGPGDVGIFVSQSGETKDILNAVEQAQAQGMRVLGLVNVLGSTLMNVSEHYLPLACGYEISVPATKTFLNQCVAFLYLALRLGGHSPLALTALPSLLEETLEQTEPQIERVWPELENRDDLYCLGYGLTYGIALEAALKLKEITYAHCEGMLSTEFKHGPLSAVHEGYPLLFVVGPDDVALLVSAINETTCRGGTAIAVGEENAQLRSNVHDLVVLPPAGPLLNPLLAILPLQVLSYRLSVARGIDPDFPRNLSKTLTVD
jgi:glucosamine--fructose-6-phosphate aminotransferase (isomerizing)